MLFIFFNVAFVCTPNITPSNENAYIHLRLERCPWSPIIRINYLAASCFAEHPYSIEFDNVVKGPKTHSNLIVPQVSLEHQSENSNCNQHGTHRLFKLRLGVLPIRVQFHLEDPPCMRSHNASWTLALIPLVSLGFKPKRLIY